ncbi:MAG: hypothetical protein JSV27_08840 [Candidatus Bathyarchaeota archaeon]|nr:MAG: hypothetical protein JSV27_08840 [Candidatus Bathyarchaeota archaeon]
MGSSHDLAFRDPLFQEEWKAQGSPASCLSCHTTGFDEDENSYKYEGVTCEQCHGPGNTMNGNVSEELCGTCHSYTYPTYEEWKNSGPSHANATCTLCHDKHTTQLSAQTPTGTCSICHESHADEVADTKHAAGGVECSDCHMYVAPPDFEQGTPASTGHTFTMTPEQLDCETCHDRPLSKHDKLGEKAFACLSCHGEIHSLEVKLINGTVYPRDESVALCAQCHNERYTSWKQGTHGKPEDHDAHCVECHDPHDPVVSGISTLPAVLPRETAGAPSISFTTAFIIVIELLGFSVIIMRWRADV